MSDIDWVFDLELRTRWALIWHLNLCQSIPFACLHQGISHQWLNSKPIDSLSAQTRSMSWKMGWVASNLFSVLSHQPTSSGKHRKLHRNNRKHNSYVFYYSGQAHIWISNTSHLSEPGADLLKTLQVGNVCYNLIRLNKKKLLSF